MARRLAKKSVPSIESTCRPGNDSHQPRDVAAGGLHFDRHRDRVAVVFDEEEDRQLLGAGDVQRFPELAFARGAFAERDVDDLVGVEARLRDPGCSRHAAVDDAGFGGADRVQHLRAGGARARTRC